MKRSIDGVDRALASLQIWLQGWPNRRRPGTAIRLGNMISDRRYVMWNKRQRTTPRQIGEMAVTNGDTNERTQHWPDK